MHHGTEAAVTRAREEVLEHVTCAVCGGEDYDVVLEAQYENEKDRRSRFRSSALRATSCSSIGSSNAGTAGSSTSIRGCEATLIFSSYAEGEDPVYVSQMEARERTFAASLAEIEQLVGAPGKTPRHRYGGGRLSRGRDAARLAGRRVRAESLARGLGVEAVRRPHPAGQRLRAELRAGELRRRHALGRHRAHDQSARDDAQHCRGLLKPGGVLVVNYPDIGSWIARALGRRWLFLTSVHLHYFDRGTMTTLSRIGRFRGPRHPPSLPAARARLHPLERRGAE